MKKLILSLVLLVSIASCDDCGDIACVTSPPVFYLELIDKVSGENLLTNGTYSENDISITNLEEQGKEVEFVFEEEDGVNLIYLYPGSEPGSVAYNLTIGSESIFNLFATLEIRKSDCCNTTVTTEFSIENAEYERDENTGNYKIFVD
ncbi:hypothetical protein [Zobellia uliginosa]|uniref:hypothetical protein n=1 Tax=Zobellia uliginosa TaxID=143224 RepID=UPI001C068881|nr:hypothetical protein [Zobellia uliginosa]MBU2945417.1 hypothetical protein [Zobellia uliginosa]